MTDQPPPLTPITCPYCNGPVMTIRRIGEVMGAQYGTVGNIVCRAPNDCLGAWDVYGHPLTDRNGDGLVPCTDKVTYLVGETLQRTAYLECVDNWGNAWGEEKHTDQPVHLYWDGEHWREIPPEEMTKVRFTQLDPKGQPTGVVSEVEVPRSAVTTGREMFSIDLAGEAHP